MPTIYIRKAPGYRFVEAVEAAEGHKKRLQLETIDDNGDGYTSVVCECQLNFVKKMVEEYEKWIKTGKLPIPSKEKAEELHYIG